MDATRWLQLKDLFRQAFDLPPEERPAFLEQHCRDPDLRARVEALLHADERSSDTHTAPLSPTALLPEGAANNASPTVLSGQAEQPGTPIGPYKLLQRIGEGGFGTVFMAEQERPLRRRVALKIIKLGMDTREVVARFEQERQALALMDHPHIARVLDGGATEAGRPYFVMELVRGVPVTEYCDTHNLNIRDRLELFIKICQAVQHAHQKGIIHRDIKPSNILVSSLDGRAHPKVIDFGIAKALRERLTDRTLFTNFQQMVGTPQYMSPEQVEASLDIDTRSDVYSLGVLLYELLTGTTPFDIRRLRSLGEVQRAIREVEPPKPSTRLGALRTADDSAAAGLPAVEVRNTGSSIVDIARQRRTDAAALVRQLRGEPDWIVMKALEKDRARRYESAGALSDDIQRFLRDEPVRASPPSRGYQLKKWVKRNKTVVVAGTSVLLALIAGLALATYGFFVARQERDAKEQARAAEAVQRRKAEDSEHTARTEAGKSQEVSQFLQEMLGSVEPRVALGRDVTLLRDVLDKAAARVGTELQGQPEVEATLRLVIGGTYSQIGEFAPGEAHLREALRLRQGTLGKSDPAVAEVLRQLAHNLFLQTRYAEAEPLLRAALRINAQTFGEESPAAARNMSNLAAQLTNLRRLDEAEILYRKAWEIQQRLKGDEQVDLPPTLANWAVLLEKRGRLEEAEQLHRAALDLLKKLYGDEHPEVVEELANLGQLRRTRGDLPEALELLREALRIHRKVCGPDHPGVAYPLTLLGRALSDQGDIAGAEAAYREVLTLREKRFVDPKDVALAWNNLAALQVERDNLAEAETGFREAAALRRKCLGEDDPQTVQAVLNLAAVLRDAGRLEEAAALQREELAICRKTPLPGQRLQAETLARLGITLAELAERAWRDKPATAAAQAAEAETVLREALAAYVSLSPAEQLLIATLKMHVGWVLADWAWYERNSTDLAAAQSRAVEAEALLREAWDGRRKTLPPADWRLPNTKGMWGWTLVVVGATTADPAAAIEAFQQAAPLLHEAYEGLSNEPALPKTFVQALPRTADGLARLYEAWDAREPGTGKADQAAIWRAKALEPPQASAPTASER